jgi:hypothetical protein
MELKITCSIDETQEGRDELNRRALIALDDAGFQDIKIEWEYQELTGYFDLKELE